MSDLTSPTTEAPRTPPPDTTTRWLPRPGTSPRGAWFGAAVVLVVLAIGVIGVVLGRSGRAGASGSGYGSGSITVTGSGTVQGVPDTIEFTVGVSTTRPSATSALKANDASMAKLERTLKRYGVFQKDLQTSNLDIYENTNNQGQLTGFTVSDTLNVTIPHVNLKGNLSKAGAAIEGAARSAGNGIQFNGITFSITNQSALLASARERAMNDALTVARQDATAGNAGVGHVLRIADQVQTQSQPVYYGPRALSSMNAGVPLLAGTQPVSVQVTVVYALT